MFLFNLMMKVNELQTAVNCCYERFQWVLTVQEDFISLELFSGTINHQIFVFAFWSAFRYPKWLNKYNVVGQNALFKGCTRLPV